MRAVTRGFVYPFYALADYARANVTQTPVYVARRNVMNGLAVARHTLGSFPQG